MASSGAARQAPTHVRAHERWRTGQLRSHDARISLVGRAPGRIPAPRVGEATHKTLSYFFDRTFSMVKEVIIPKRGSGGGCNAPWDMQQVLNTALKSQNSPVEMVWQWQNFNWAEWFKELKAVTKEFTAYCSYRHWVYEVPLCLPICHLSPKRALCPTCK